MASKNKTYIQKAIDKALKSYESPVMGFLRIEEEEIERLRTKLAAIISGNEVEYEQKINDRIQAIEEKIAAKEAKEQAKLEKEERDNFGEQEVAILGAIPEEPVKLQRDSKSYKTGIAVGVASAAAMIAMVVLVSCGGDSKEDKKVEPPSIDS